MGLYAYINENDRINMRKVEDLDIKTVFEEALKHDKTLMLSEGTYYERAWMFGKQKEVKHFAVYHEEIDSNGKSLYQARQQMSASGSKSIVLAYLYGIINGSISAKNPKNN